jgi:tetratricopeptide (TPR) repeat protein
MPLPRWTLAVVATLLTAAGCSRNAEYYHQRGVKMAEAGKDAEAVLDFRKAIQKDPRSGQAYLDIGLAYQRQGNVAEAYRTLHQAVRLMPHSKDVKIKLAEFCLEVFAADPTHPKLLHDELSRMADQLLAEDDRSVDGLRLKGNAALVDKRFDEAIELLRKADRIKPMQPNVVLPLVRSLFEANQRAEAERMALQLIEREKAFGPIYDVLYTFYARENRMSEAERLLQRKVENNPGDDGPRLQLAALYAYLKRGPAVAVALRPLLDDPKAFPKARLHVGDFYRNTGSFGEAMALYQEGLKASPADRLLFQKRIVELLLQQGKRDEAAQAVDAALKEQPADPDLRTARAALLLDTGKPRNVDTAVSIFEAMVKEKPGDAARRVNLARAAIGKGDLDSARRELLSALRIVPSSATVRVLLAEVSLRKREFGDVVKYSDEILARQPDSPWARLERSAGLMGLGRYAEARADLEKSLASQPQSVDAQLQLGNLNMVEGHFKEAESIFRKSSETAKGDLRAIEGLLAAQVEQRQFESALGLIRAEVAKAPDSTPLRRLLAQTALRVGQRDLALDQYKRLVSANPEDLDLLLEFGEVLRGVGNYPEALAQFERAGRVAPKDPRFLVSVATTEELMGRKEAAREHYRKAMALRPDDPNVMNNLAYLIVETGGNPQEAQRLAQEALKRQPQQPDFTDTLGWVYLKSGHSDSALQVFRNLVRKYADNPTFRYHLAASMEQKGDRAAAREALAGALALKPSGSLESDIRQLQSRLN